MKAKVQKGSAAMAAMFTLTLVVAAFPAAALQMDLPTTAPAVVPSDPVREALLALLNGDMAQARAHAIDAYAELYGSAPTDARLVDAYAHQYVFMQNPVLNPGFELGEDAAVVAWDCGDACSLVEASGSRALEVAMGASIMQRFGGGSRGLVEGDLGAFVDDFQKRQDTSFATGPYWHPDAITLDVGSSVNATVSIVLVEKDFARTWTTLPVNISSEAADWARLSIPVTDFLPQVFDTDGDLVATLSDGSVQKAASLLQNSAIASLSFKAADDTPLLLDNIVVSGAAFGPDPRAAIHLDERSLSGSLPAMPLPLQLLRGHDGYSLIVLPVDFVPTLLADGTASIAPSATEFATEGDWSFFVTAVEHTPSGPRIVAPESVELRLGDTFFTSAPSRVETATLVDDGVELASLGDAGALFAGVYAAQGLGASIPGVHVQVADLAAGQASFVLANATLSSYYAFPADAYADGFHVEGFFNAFKTLEPGHALGDVADLEPQSFYAVRQALAAATYATERRTDLSDGYLALVSPAGYRPEASQALPAVLRADVDSNYNLTVEFFDYRVGHVDAATGAEPITPAGSAIVALFANKAAALATLQSRDGDWLAGATFVLCDSGTDFAGHACDAPLTTAGDSLVASVPAGPLADITQTNGGTFWAVAYLDVGDSGDAELGTLPARGGFSHAANVLAARAAGAGVTEPVTIAPHYLYAAADAASYALAPITLLPISDVTDGRAVIIEPQFLDESGILKPLANGNYTFDVFFRAYAEDGTILGDLPADPVDITFRLIDAAQLPDNGAVDPTEFLWESEAANITPLGNNGFRVEVEAHTLPFPYDVQGTFTRSTSATQNIEKPHMLYAWAALDVAAPELDTPLGDGTTRTSGYYNPDKNDFANSAVADQLDYVPASLRLDRSLEQYDVLITPTNADFERGETKTLEFEVKNMGKFPERFDLSLTISGSEAADWTVGALSASFVQLDPQDTAVVSVDVTAGPELTNNLALNLLLKAELSHLRWAEETSHFSRSASLFAKVAPLFWNFATTPGFMLAPVPGTTYTVDLNLSTTGDTVPETFTMSNDTAATYAGVTVVIPTATSPVMSDYSWFNTTATYTVGETVPRGIARAVKFMASPDHDSTKKDFQKMVTPPKSFLTLTGAVVTSEAKPTEQFSFSWDLVYEGPYQETFTLAPRLTNFVTPVDFEFEMSGDADATLDAVARTVAFDGRGVDDVRATLFVNFTVPAGTDFDTHIGFSMFANSTTSYSNLFPGKADAPSAVGANGYVKGATLDLLAQSVTAYALPGETVTRTVTLQYVGNFSTTFGVSILADSVGGASIDGSSVTFDGTGLLETADITVTLPLTGRYYNDSTSVTIGLSKGDDWTPDLPAPVEVTAAVYNLAPTLVIDEGKFSAFPREVGTTVPATLVLPAFTRADEMAQWNARDSQNVYFEMATSYLDAAAWSDVFVDNVSLVPGGSFDFTIAATPAGLAADDEVTFTATGMGLPATLGRTDTRDIHLVTPADLKAGLTLVGCYGVNATDCERVTGPVQSLASHDSLAGNYSRAYMMLSLVNVYDEARPVYVDLAGSDATASLTVTASPTYGATESLVLTTPTAIPADAEFSALRMQGTQFLMLPNLQPGDAEAHTGLAILLWETGETFPEGTNTDWFLGHLGTIGIEANLSAFDVTSPNATFDAARALAPLANVASAAQARVVTDKDDPDGDGYSTLVELRGGSNPLSRASTPYTDDDADGVANGADLVPFLDERALLTAASGGSGPEPFAQALARIVAAYQPRL